MTNPQPTIESFSTQDINSFQILWRKELWAYLRKYLILFLLLTLIYYTFEPVIADKLPNIRAVRFQIGISVFLTFFSLSFLGFAIWEYFTWLRLVRKDLIQKKKQCFFFAAQKYYDPIFKCCLLFYPGVEDQYICIDADSFDKIEDGEPLRMEISPFTETIMLIKSNSIEINKAVKFRFR